MSRLPSATHATNGSENSNATAPFTTLPKLSGNIPGILDSTQVGRLCRFSDSKLSFASFDPFTATSSEDMPGLEKLSLNTELYRPKRVVVETSLANGSTWRFVPSAQRDQGLTDEGTWPQVVDVCGKHFECSLEQWDIYKLDPTYDCYVRAPPDIPIITRVSERPPSPSSSFSQKRRESSSEEFISRKEARLELESDNDESEVEEMIIDDHFERPKSAGPTGKTAKLREQTQASRRERQERMARRIERLSNRKNVDAENAEVHSTIQPSDGYQSVSASLNNGKRKVATLFNSLRTNKVDNGDTPWSVNEKMTRSTTNYIPARKEGKRTRTVSPSAAKRNMAANKLVREKLKTEQRRQKQDARKLARDAEMLAELYRDMEVPDAWQGSRSDQGKHDERIHEKHSLASDDFVYDKEAARQAVIEESRRKLAELEADRPLWEEAARKRREREAQEAEALRKKNEIKRRTEDAQRGREQIRQEGAYQRIREETLRKRLEQEEKVRRQQAKRERDSWGLGYWNVERAKKRYINLAERFDKTKFSPRELPLTVYDVPWPMLSREYELEDVTWQAVAEFFDAIRPTMRTVEYKKLIIKSHQRFHTDRWAGRRLIESVIDDTERECIEIANKMVIQQLTPIWEYVCGRQTH